MTDDAPHPGDAEQAEVIDFLGSTAAHGAGVGEVERCETHGAVVFLAGEHALKIKRSIRYAYMDFSTLELRHRACLREIEINQPHAPEIYLRVVAITREPDGSLAIGGKGATIEWAVHMRRFGSDDLLSAVAETRGIDAPLARDLADVVQAFHAGAVVANSADPRAALRGVVDELVVAFRDAPLGFALESVDELEVRCAAQLERIAPILARRAAAGRVRRCHGDLHLGNIVLWRGRPTLFDALEFDEKLATIDTLYDLAFLLMDLDQRGQRAAANVVLNRYLWRSQSLLDLEGLAALPLFLGLRAAIRAMVLAQRASVENVSGKRAAQTAATAYFNAALGYLSPVPARMIAVGGLSGTGKSTLAAALESGNGPAPGAVHLRSDLERKALFGVAETDRLEASCYTQETGRRVYEMLLRKAKAVLAAGHTVIVDAVFLDQRERGELEQVAQNMGVPFTGLWLAAPESAMTRRVADRKGDASDATPDVVRRQITLLDEGDGSCSWSRVDASGTPEATLAAARAVLG